MQPRHSISEKNNTLPSGTLTFLFTDIEGSTRLWEQFPEAMKVALQMHDTLLRETIAAHGGYVFKTVGDAFCAAFPTAPGALQAALDAQRRLHAEAWGGTPIKVCMALHTGATEERDGDYFGPPLNRVARLLSAGFGGQVLLSLASQELVCDQHPSGVSLRDLGEHRLKDLARPEHIFQLILPDLPNDFPPIKTLDTLANNLPVQLTSFIGREKEISEVKRLLHENRLVTITGPGGTGKTRLSLQTAADLLEVFPNGVWLVELAPLADPALVPQAVATALGVREQQGRPLQDSLTDYLREKKLLLILDNCEHLVEACAALADALLHACPGLKVLASSREALGISGEFPYRLPSLSTPDTRHLPPTEKVLQYEAVRLFNERAVTALPSFNITNENAPALAQVCRRLDGIPLAIELAAARVRMLSVEQIASRLDDCFRLLTGGSRTALPRLQTLQALIDWSYDLLSDSERSLLCRLAVFAGGWTLEAAEAVCAQDCSGTDVLDLLTQLVNKSLVVVDYAEGQQTRYRLLETVRQYALQKLAKTGEGPQVRTRHLAYFLQLAEEAEPHLFRTEQLDWLARLDQEHDNLRVAFVWAMDGIGDDPSAPPEAGLRLANSLYMFWIIGGYWLEAREWYARALATRNQSVQTVAHARALSHAGFFEDNLREEIRLLDESLVLCREMEDKHGIAFALRLKASLILFTDDHSSPRSILEECLALFRELGDKWGVASTLYSFGLIAAYREYDLTAARRYFEESLKLHREIGDRSITSMVLNHLGELARDQDEPSSARAYYEESLSMARELGNKFGIAICLGDLGFVDLWQGDCQKAEKMFEESQTIAKELGDKFTISYNFFAMGRVARFQGDYKKSADFYEKSMFIGRQTDNKYQIAWSLFGLGELARLQGDHATAYSFCRQAVPIAKELDDRDAIANMIEEVASLCAAQGKMKPSATLFGAAQALRTAIHMVTLPFRRQELERDIALVREKMGETAFAVAWAEGQALTYEQAVDLVNEVLKPATTGASQQ